MGQFYSSILSHWSCVYLQPHFIRVGLARIQARVTFKRCELFTSQKNAILFIFFVQKISNFNCLHRCVSYLIAKLFTYFPVSCKKPLLSRTKEADDIKTFIKSILCLMDSWDIFCILWREHLVSNDMKELPTYWSIKINLPDCGCVRASVAFVCRFKRAKSCNES